GIVGMWNLDGKPVEREVLARMSATLAHRGLDGEKMWIKGPVGLACQLFRVTPESAEETQPLVDSRGIVLVFDGRLDNREELLASLRDSYQVSSSSPDPALVLAAYEAFGDRLPERLAGDFALGLFDPNRQHLLLARDAIGIRPLYYYRTRDTFLFASEIKALLAHPAVSPKPNDDTLADFLLNNVRDQEITFFEGISSLPPAHMALLTPQSFSKRRYWDFDAGGCIRLGSFDEYATAFRHLFEQAVRRRLRSAHPVAVSVSGGLDSSSILCVAETLARREPRVPRIQGVSYTSREGSPSDERGFLVEVEKKYGTTIHRVPMGPMGLVDGSEEAVRQLEVPWLDEQWDNICTFHRKIQHLGSRVVLTGHWADHILFPQGYLVDLFRSLAWRKIRTHLNEFGLWLTDADPRHFPRRFFLGVVKYHLPRPLYPLIRRLRVKRDRPWYSKALQRRAFRRAWKQTANGWTPSSAHARSLYEEVRSAHHLLCMDWNNKMVSMHGLEMAYPFLDRDLLSFLMAVPGEVLTWNGVPKGLLRTAMHGVLPEAIVHRRWKADFSHLVNEAVEQDFPRLIHALDVGGQAVTLGYVTEDDLNKNLKRLRNRISGPTCDVAWSLSDLLGLELWLRIFFGESGSGEPVFAEGPSETKPQMISGGKR
ncbi:MAG: asparagine synthase (glutamine-hydrolyzing), partial [Candidatus Methylomirabilales bacterium]